VTRDKLKDEEGADASKPEAEPTSSGRTSQRLARAPSSDDLAAFAEDGLDDAFDSISSASLPVPEAPPTSGGRSSQRLAPMPSSDDLAAFAEDGLDDAFDSISSASLTVPEAPPSVSFTGAPSSEPSDPGAKEGEVVEVEEVEEGEVAEAAEDEDIDLDYDTLTPVTFGDSLPEIWEGCHPVDRATTLTQRIHMCEATVRVHELFQSSTDEKIARSNVLDAVKEFEEELEGIKPKSKRGRELTKSIIELLEPIEKQQAEYEKKIPVSWLRGPYLRLDLDFAIRVGYFHACLQRSDLSAAWWERVVILAVGSASSADKMGTLTTLPITYVSALWDTLFPDTRLDPETVESNVKFFHDAAGQLPELEDPRHLFSTDFYIDVIGYQVTLREALFRPETLYACVEFHVQLANWADGDTVGRVLQRTMDEDISLAYEKVKTIFKTETEDEDAIEKMQARMRGLEAQKKRIKEREEKDMRYGRKAVLARKLRSQKRRRIAFRVITAAVVLLMGYPLVSDMFETRSRDLKDMSAGDTQELHPMFASASISKEAGLMVATIDGENWAVMSEKERKKVADRLVSYGGMNGFRSLMVYVNDVLVIDVTGGAARFVD
jgi:hypothetical protein